MRAAACGRGSQVGPIRGSRARLPAIVAAAPGGERRSGGGGSSAARRGGGTPNRRGAGARKAPPAKQQQGRQQQPKGKKQQQAGEDAALVQPLRWHVQGELSTSERMPAPYWSTFCGVSNGLWCGITQAVSPSTGQPEPLALDDQRKPLLQLHQCCVEERVVEEEGDGADCVVRHVTRASTLEGLQREMVQGGQLVFPACGVPGAAGVSECWDEERFSSCQEGLVVFDGGSYSLGPGTMGSPTEAPVKEAVAFDEAAAAAAAAALEAALAAHPAADSVDLLQGEQAEEEEEVEEEAGSEAEAADTEAADKEEAAATAAALKLAKEETAEFDWTAVVIEHCMQWGGEQRLRIRLTLDTAGGADGTELEVQPLRVAVAREAWEGLPGSFTPATPGAGAAEQQEASRRVRLDTSALAGHWKVFEVSAVTVDDVSMQTGLPTRSTLYSAQETSRRLGRASEGGQGGDEGALLLLPHSAGVQLEALRLDNGRRRGVRVSTHWSPQPDMLLSMARLYDADGKVLEVSTSTAIRDAAADLAERSI